MGDVIRIYSFGEWASHIEKKKLVCAYENSYCVPNANAELCIECYEDYVKTCIPKYNKE